MADSPPSAPDREPATVHLRCGSDVRDGLAAAGYVGEFFEFADPLCQGPVANVGVHAAIELRARFMAAAWGADYDEARTRLTREYARLEELRECERVVMWFEHDSYDQLILARVLAAFAQGKRPATLELICIDDYPGVGRFLGLGQLAPADLRGLWPRRIPVSTDMLEHGARVFAALASDDAQALHTLAGVAPPTLASMGPAIERHLQELPGVVDGLSRTQRQVLQLLADGARRGGALFRANQDVDPLPFLGDDMFAAVLRELANGPTAAIATDSPGESWIPSEWRLTEVGRRVHAGDADWLASSGVERWVGGIRIADGHAGWRWDPERSRPTAS